MLIFPSMLLNAAEQAGMKIPADADDFNREQYPHFAVFCAVQLGRPMNLTDHWENAKVIAAIPDSEISKVTFAALIAKGLAVE